MYSPPYRVKLGRRAHSRCLLSFPHPCSLPPYRVAQLPHPRRRCLTATIPAPPDRLLLPCSRHCRSPLYVPLRRNLPSSIQAQLVSVWSPSSPLQVQSTQARGKLKAGSRPIRSALGHIEAKPTNPAGSVQPDSVLWKCTRPPCPHPIACCCALFGVELRTPLTQILNIFN